MGMKLYCAKRYKYYAREEDFALVRHTTKEPLMSMSTEDRSSLDSFSDMVQGEVSDDKEEDGGGGGGQDAEEDAGDDR
jgi:hypothetical protein